MCPLVTLLIPHRVLRLAVYLPAHPAQAECIVLLCTSPAWISAVLSLMRFALQCTIALSKLAPQLLLAPPPASGLSLAAWCRGRR